MLTMSKTIVKAETCRFKVLLFGVVVLNCWTDAYNSDRNRTSDSTQTSKSAPKEETNGDSNYDFQNPYPPIEDTASDANFDYFASYDGDYSARKGKTNASDSFYDTDSVNTDPEIFPNPELMPVYDNMADQGKVAMFTDPMQLDVFNNIRLPDNSLADADLKDHNLIDSVNYVYGILGSASTKKEWMFIVLITRVMAVAISAVTLLMIMFARTYDKFRKKSKMYPVQLNLLSSLLTCNIIYLIAIVDTTSFSRCEMIAILLHYAHLVCCAWLLMQCKLTANWADDTKYNPGIKCVYIFTYVMPSIMVLIFFVASTEKYETLNYCWMSVENGMLLGCMFPVCVFIVGNTFFAIIGQRCLSLKKTEIITSKIHEMLNNQDMTFATSNAAANVDLKQLETGSDLSNDEGCRDLNQPRCSQTDSMDLGITSGTSVNFVEMNLDITRMSTAKSPGNMTRIDLTSLSLDNLSWKSATTEEVDSLKNCLNFSLILQPLFCVSWLMGVIALENCHHWLTPSIFLVLSMFMYTFIAVHFFTVIPIICDETEHEYVEPTDKAQVQNQVRQQATPLQQRSMDNIPLLVSNVTPSTAPIITADAISTISI